MVVCCFRPVSFRDRQPQHMLALSRMAMTASSRSPVGAASNESERSPFARTTELLAPYKPGKPLITLSLGEPQHPLPGFVGPVLAQHIAFCGRYPLPRAKDRLCTFRSG